MVAMFVALAATPGASLFAGVIYDFSGVVFGTKQIFRYTAQRFVTTDTFVPAAAWTGAQAEASPPASA
jgi:hypothetical protein